MKSMRICTILLAAIILVQCSKSKDENGPDLKKGLLAFFPFDNELYDSTKELQIFYSGIFTYGQDRKGNGKSAVSFDGTYCGFFCDDWSAAPLSISLWVKPKDNNNDNYFLQAESAVFGMYQHGPLMGLAISVANTNSALATIGIGWMHVVGTYDGTDIKTYIDGELKETMHHPGEPGKTKKVTIGSVSAPDWKGSVDDLRFYNRLLSEEEIRLLAK